MVWQQFQRPLRPVKPPKRHNAEHCGDAWRGNGFLAPGNPQALGIRAENAFLMTGSPEISTQARVRLTDGNL